jgi:hypothetical protein
MRIPRDAAPVFEIDLPRFAFLGGMHRGETSRRASGVSGAHFQVVESIGAEFFAKISRRDAAGVQFRCRR